MKRQILTVPRRGRGMPHYSEGPHGEAPGLVRGKENSGKIWVRAFIVVSAGRNR